MLYSLALVRSISFAQILTFSQCFIFEKKKKEKKRLCSVMFLALAHKEDSTGSEGLEGVGNVFLKY